MPARYPAEDTVGVPPDTERAVRAITDWYQRCARDLPWRAADRTAWGVLVSEIMLQQTQVSRVAPSWRHWMRRWPTPELLAGAPVSEAIRAWQGLGYPRRAIRLHAAAVLITHRHGGNVPESVSELRELPGVGEYTAAAVHAFAHGGTVAVLDTNVRRVLSRWRSGQESPATAGVSPGERRLAEQLLPREGSAPLWSVAVMELGALVCTAQRPACPECPISEQCAWLAAGRPAGPKRRSQPRFEGSDRQARGFVLRAASHGPATHREIVLRWCEQRGQTTLARAQAERAVASLQRDGLIELRGGIVRLPG